MLRAAAVVLQQLGAVRSLRVTSSVCVARIGIHALQRGPQRQVANTVLQLGA